jgi:signal transduction histidine kinase
MRLRAETAVLLLSAAGALVCGAGDLVSRQNEDFPATKPSHLVTNVAQFRTLSGLDYIDGCDFHLTGVVTLVDMDRHLVVLQDATGAVALNSRIEGQVLRAGQLATLEGTNCCPCFADFPDYPHRPSGWDIRNSFEAPSDWGEYNLTRMRGWLHPPVTGEYTFWIASDNSSELWLSLDANASKARRIAFIPRFGWVAPREWSRYASQRSESILLKAGEAYYIEALQEQTTQAEHLAVAWQGPAANQSVIQDRYLTPWGKGGSQAGLATNKGILREYWTNFSAGDLAGMGGARPFESALSVEQLRAIIRGPGKWPKPGRIALNQPWLAEDNFRWVEAEGLVKFTGADGDGASLELSDGQALVQVRASHWSPEMSRRISNVPIRVEGVCEGVYDQNGTMVPGLIWASAENSISVIETVMTNASAPSIDQPARSTSTTTTATQGFYLTRGVVTFNDRVFENDFVFVQEDAAAVLVALDNRYFKNQLKVGQWVDLGGALEPGKYLPVITPLVVTELGRYFMPLPIAQPLGFPAPANRNGRWSEFEGVVHSVNSNDTLSVVGKEGSACLWLGQTPAKSLTRFVDAKLRARGVLLLNLLDAPVLLVPSRNFIDVEEAAPEDRFGTPRRSIADLLPEVTESSGSHRVRVMGEITYRDAQSFFIQDASGGIRVRTSAPPVVAVGDTVEMLAFPALNGFVRTVTEALVRPATAVEHVSSKSLDLSEALSSRQSGALVHVSATLLARKTNGISQVLELQEQQRVFTATLAAGQDSLPDNAPGSRLRVTGVCDNETTAASLTGEKPARAQMLASLNILLRSPGDVTLLSGPPWWTWKRTATLVGTLLTVLLVTLLWVHLLRRRLERQHAAQLAFSRQVLEKLEDERRRIAINLHDSLGQILLAIKNQALLAIQRPPDEQGLRKRLDEISGATSQAIEEVRQITHGLRPYQLDRLGLAQAIRASVSHASSNGTISFASRVEDIDGLFDKDAEIHVYRIVQEAVNNVVKHSAATEAAVVIKKRTGVVTLSIRDSGRGFDAGSKPSSQPHDLGYGLSGIAERVRILGGTLTIDSRPGEGTSLTVEVPLPICKHETGSHSADRG